MEKGVVYKQRYCSVSDKAVVSKNAAHLIYIATRPGTIYNENCGFGLWGKLHGMRKVDNIEDLMAASQRVKEISKENKTIYRGVVSLKGLDAKEKGYVTREKWQELVTKQINKIALEKNMNIAPRPIFSWSSSVTSFLLSLLSTFSSLITLFSFVFGFSSFI